uniref:DUF19 domain-containing protein n=1 Tax=Strigamia maritima TaxID=126957 RepID=T1IWE9_STRMM
MNQFIFIITEITFLILDSLISAQGNNLIKNVTTATKVPISNTSSPTDICELNPNLSYINDQTQKYKNCIASVEVKLFPFNCTQYKTIVNCFRDYTAHVHTCFKEMEKDWEITNNILTDATKYLCNPKTELLHSFYLHGGKHCLSGNELHHCGPSVVNMLLNNSKYSTFSKQLLAQNYSLDKCSEEDSNAQCALHGISLNCKQLPNITLIADNLHKIVMKHTGCSSNSSSIFGIGVNINALIMLFDLSVINFVLDPDICIKYH